MTIRARPALAAVVVALLAVYLVWGSTYLAIRYAIETIPPLLGAGGRFVVAGAILFIVLRLRGALAGQRIDAATWRSAAVVGVLLLLGGNGLVVLGEQFIPSGIAALLVATTPIWFALFEAIVSRRRPSALVIGGLVAGFAGVAVLVAPSGGAERIDLLGLGLVLLAPVSWAAGSVYARRAPMPESPFVATAMEMVVGGGAMLVVSILTGDLGRFDPAAVSASSALALGYLVLFGSLVGFTAYIWLLHNVPAATASTYAYVNPVVAIVLGAVIAREPIGPQTIIAAAVILAAVVAMVSGRHREAPASDADRPEARPAPDRSIADA